MCKSQTCAAGSLAEEGKTGFGSLVEEVTLTGGL